MADLQYTDIVKLLKYEPETGKLYWLERPVDSFPPNQYQKRSHSIWQARFANKEAFTANSHGYKCGRISGKNYPAHRVAWILHYGCPPKSQIDHENGDRGDNRICNLRDVTAGENRKNQRINSKNTSGFMGVTWSKRKNKWQASIHLNRKKIHLGYFPEIEGAIAARKKGEIYYGFHPNHGRLE